MPTNARRERHNVRVTPRRARQALIVALIAPALLLSGCGSDSKDKPKAKPSVDLPTGNVTVPPQISLTEAGTALKFGQPARVTFEPNTHRGSVLSLTVLSVQTGRIADFAAYQLDPRTKRSRPYYVRVLARNIGTGDLSRSAVPLLAVDNRDTLIQPSTFNNDFAKCPSLPLPAGFGPKKAYRGCLVYLVPSRGTLVKMSFRPLQTFEPITWDGTIQPAPTQKTKKKTSKKPTKKPSKKPTAKPSKKGTS
jgi:hypothetical protein